MARDKETDLFPWILGALLLAAGGGAMVAALEGGRQAPATTAPVALTAPPLVPATPAAPVPVAAVPAAPVPAAVVTQPTAAPPLPLGQVWQCTVNGQKTFSDSPCGAGASIRQLSDVNRMAPAPTVPAAAYAPPPYSSDDRGPGDEPAPPNDDAYAAGAAPVIIVNRRPRHDHRPRPHPHGTATGGGHPGGAQAGGAAR